MSEPTFSPSPPVPVEPDITSLLRACAVGDARAAEELLPLVYDQLRRSAQQQLRQEPSDHTLQATDLVHEAYLRLVRDEELNWAGRAHFYFASAEAMRRILIEHARARARVKRGGDGSRPPNRTPINDASLVTEQDFDKILMLDDALRRLESEDPQAAAVVRLRYFAGLTIDQTAAAMGLSPSSVDREWAFARARLHRFMKEP